MDSNNSKNAGKIMKSRGHVKKIFCCLLAVVMVCTMVTWPPKPAEAATKAYDFGNWSELQDIIYSANEGDTLDLTLRSQTVYLDSPVIINKPLTINFYQPYIIGFTRIVSNNNNSPLFYASRGVHLNFNNIILTSSNNAGGGGAIACFRGYGDNRVTSITGASFIDCSSKGDGGAIHVPGDSFVSVTIKDCIFKDCVSREGNGGAISVNFGGARIENCYFDGCESKWDGGAFFSGVQNNEIRNSIFNRCKAGERGGAIRHTANITQRLKVEDCRFINCSAKTNGYYVDSSNPDDMGWNWSFITHCTQPYDGQYYMGCDFYGACKKEYLTKVDGRPPTCTEAGWAPYYKCWCGNIYNSETPDNNSRIYNLEEWKKDKKSNGGYRPAKGHDFDGVRVVGNTIAARCKNDLEHRLSLTLEVKDSAYSGKAENVQISGNASHDDWTKYGLDYDFYYTDEGGNRLGGAPVNVGTYKAVIDVKKGSDVQQTLEKSFTIAKKTITEGFITLEFSAKKYDNGNTIVNSIKYVKDGQKELIKGTDYTVDSNGLSGSAKGTYTVTVTGQGNYEGTAKETWYIVENEITIVTDPMPGSITYGQSLKDSQPFTGGLVQDENQTKVDGRFEWESLDIIPEVSDSDKTLYTVVFLPNDINYNIIEKEITVTVNPLDLSKIPLNYITVPTTYTGDDLIDYITVDLDGDAELELIKGTDYTVSCSPSAVKEPGKYTATISFQGNYTGTATKEFTLVRELEDEDITIEVPEISDESELKDSFIKVMFGDKQLDETADYDVAYKLISFRGPVEYKFSATITFKGIYGGVVVKEFTVILPNYEPPAPTPTPTPVPQETTYIPSFSPGLPALPSTQGTIGDGTDSSTIKIRVNTSNGNATIANIPESTISSVASTTEKPIVIDVSGSGRDGKKVSKITIPRATAENLARALDTPINIKDRFTIIIDTAVLKFDTKAFVSIAGQAKGDNMQIVVEEKSQTRLNNSQKSALESLNNGQGKSVAQTFEAYIISGGKVISTFEGGQISIGMIDFKIPAGKNPKYYHVYYLPEAGEPELCTTWVEDGMIFYGTGHFSDYAIVYDESMENGIDREVFRLYDKNTGEHLLTTDDNEVKVLTAAGWVLEGSVGKGANYGEEVFRLYNAATREHLYTADKNECNTLTAERGWVYDNNGKPLIYGLLSGKAMYRVYNASLPSIASHHYTSDPNEVKVLTTERGYVSDNAGQAVFYLN